MVLDLARLELENKFIDVSIAMRRTRKGLQVTCWTSIQITNREDNILASNWLWYQPLAHTRSLTTATNEILA